MASQSNRDCDAVRYELRFWSLFRPGRGYTFPCDAQGHVDLGRLGSGARRSYLYARSVVGRELAAPLVLSRLAGDAGKAEACRHGATAPEEATTTADDVKALPVEPASWRGPRDASQPTRRPT